MSTDDQIRNDRDIPGYAPQQHQQPQPGGPGQYGAPGQYGGPGQHGGPAAYGQQAPMSPELERQLVCAAHWSPIASVLLGGMTFFGPLIVLLVGGGRSRAVRDHAIDALNFQITAWLAIVASVLISLPLMIVVIGFITVWLAPTLIGLGALVVHGIAAVKVAAGEPYRYPFTWQLIK